MAAVSCHRLERGSRLPPPPPPLPLTAAVFAASAAGCLHLGAGGGGTARLRQVHLLHWHAAVPEPGRAQGGGRQPRPRCSLLLLHTCVPPLLRLTFSLLSLNQTVWF